MPRKRTPKPWKIGYEADAWLASQQITDLISSLNATVVSVRPTGSDTRKVRLPPSDAQIELRRLVTKWKASGPNLRVLFKREPELAKRTRHGKTVFWSTPTGRGHLDWIPEPPATQHSLSEDEALGDFMRLITNPEWNLLGGPCGRCGMYFLKTRGRKKYCSRVCGTRTTATQSVAKKRERVREQKLASARKAIRRWRDQSRFEDWKTWVAKETRLTTNWLTIAVNQKDLKPPAGRRKMRLPLNDSSYLLAR